jgi:Family of unknown function (DUF5946)
MENRCPECGANWSSGVTCQDHFYQMGYWEMADIEHLGVVHHLMVLSYHLQHPSLYSPDGLTHAKGLLVDFVERGVTPQQVRQRDRAKVDSGKRQFKIAGTPEAHGVSNPPIAWAMTAADVVAGGTEHYVEYVKTWAQSIYVSLKAAHQL